MKTRQWATGMEKFQLLLGNTDRETSSLLRITKFRVFEVMEMGWYINCCYGWKLIKNRILILQIDEITCIDISNWLTNMFRIFCITWSIIKSRLFGCLWRSLWFWRFPRLQMNEIINTIENSKAENHGCIKNFSFFLCCHI